MDQTARFQTRLSDGVAATRPRWAATRLSTSTIGAVTTASMKTRCNPMNWQAEFMKRAYQIAAAGVVISVLVLERADAVSSGTAVLIMGILGVAGAFTPTRGQG
jgi:hypothetical protein